jgi:hypothetical protein
MVSLLVEETKKRALRDMIIYFNRHRFQPAPTQSKAILLDI